MNTIESLSAMSDDQLRVLVAERCGWLNISMGYGRVHNDLCGSLPSEDKSLPASLTERAYLPNYPHSLDAMHEAEKTMTQEQQRKYTAYLEYGKDCSFQDFQTNSSLFQSITKSARQRAIAFILATDGRTP